MILLRLGGKMNFNDVKRMKEIGSKLTPRPWPITGPDKFGSFKMEVLPGENIYCRNMAALEYIALAVAFADSVELGRQAKTSVDLPQAVAQG